MPRGPHLFQHLQVGQKFSWRNRRLWRCFFTSPTAVCFRHVLIEIPQSPETLASPLWNRTIGGNISKQSACDSPVRRVATHWCDFCVMVIQASLLQGQDRG
eukprot:Protomagalhaensia_wolfi_Nauph_80__4569@NODE_46_length_4258_cov_300_005452_g37_i0_p7_GENE_NODE_46_length_4258_cov_300_005452_g37_i0NODE_46_length_4258_cov_300_005452_g37_i0_p7_ORF_typecomplete_len101_score0_37DUF2509/PF10713_9/0_24Gemini_AL1/PF00799_20/0_24_NODE_46_length_4258_cov_300_005452_g37_i08901192